MTPLYACDYSGAQRCRQTGYNHILFSCEVFMRLGLALSCLLMLCACFVANCSLKTEACTGFPI